MNSVCVDLIYLDPPFNSNRTYEAPIGSEAAGAAFKDAWTLDDVDVHEHGELADRSPATYAVIEAARHSHGKGMMAYLIMMAVRLLEMKRILKPTGSIYLHCDPTASHYLKLMMDSVFGRNNFQNELVWRRVLGGKSDATRYGRSSDRLLFYTMSDKYYFNAPRMSDHNMNTVRTWYTKMDERGKYQSRPLTAAGSSGGDSGQDWRGVKPTGHWVVPKLLAEKYTAETGLQLIGSVRERLDILADSGYIEFSSGGKPSWRKYLSEANLPRVHDIWADDDVRPISRTSKERLDYPTQKPTALLERIISASSNQGDLVFDPFCGCATALVAADRLGRRWAGIDLSSLAVKLVNKRIINDQGPVFSGAIVPEAPPSRTDLGDLPNYRTHKHRIYGEQEGVCAGCDTHFPFRIFEVDHILPKSKGGTDHIDNLQLLCSHCNRSKGGRTMAEWHAAGP